MNAAKLCRLVEAFSPPDWLPRRDQLDCRINQLLLILRHSKSAGIRLTTSQKALCRSILGGLSRDCRRASGPTTPLSTHAANDFVASWMPADRL